jgi:toxin ParE1/3/4
MEVRWSENASAEIVEVFDYLSRYSEAGAWRAVRAILGRGLQLERFPNSGRRIFPDSGEDIREVFAGPYRIVYHNAGDGVEVLSVRHGRRRLELPPAD